MVEIARAFSVSNAHARLIILDEPTSSLDAHTAGQLLSHVRRSVESGMSCALISHILGEVLEACDRIVVMRDGKVVAADASRNFNRATWVAAVGGAERDPAVERAAAMRGAQAEAPIVVRMRAEGQTDGQQLVAR